MKNPVLVWSFKACLLGSPLLMHRYLLIQHDEYFITKDDTKQIKKVLKIGLRLEVRHRRNEAEDAICISVARRS